MNDKLKVRTKMAYGFGNFGFGTVSQTMNNFIMFFGTSVVGIPGTLVGIAISIATVWDAFTDPVVGYLSDRYNSPTTDTRKLFMFIASILLAIINIMLWSIPSNLSTFSKFTWLLFSLILFESADTIFSTPYTALGFEQTNDTHENTSIQSYKTFFFLLGMIAPSILMMIFMKSDGLEIRQIQQEPYQQIGYITSILCIISGLICIAGTKRSKYSNHLKRCERLSFFSIVLLIINFLKKKETRYVMLGYSVSTIATCFLTSIGFHVFTYSFHFSSSQISLLMITLFIGAIISQYFIIKTSKKLGKNKTLIKYILILIASVGIIAIVFALRELFSTSTTFYILLFLVFFCGFGSGSLYSLPFSIFSDIIRKNNYETRENQTALLSGILTFTFKMSNAVALLIIGIILDYIKFNSTEPVQPLKVQNALGIILIFGISISLALTISLFSKCKDYD